MYVLESKILGREREGPCNFDVCVWINPHENNLQYILSIHFFLSPLNCNLPVSSLKFSLPPESV